MKKIFFALLFVAGNCHAEYLTLTEVIPGHYLYVFKHKYVVRILGEMPNVPVGQLMKFNIDDFYAKESWNQDFKIRDGYTIDEYEFKYEAVGILDDTPLDMEGFFQLIHSANTVGPLESFATFELQDTWFQKINAFNHTTFSTVETIDWVFKEYRRYLPSFSHDIRAIFDKNDKDLLVGILNHALNRRFYSHDHKYTYARFKKS